MFSKLTSVLPPEEQKSDPSDNYEQESQFILRLPSLPAASLRAAVKSGKGRELNQFRLDTKFTLFSFHLAGVLNLKDRLNIQIEQDMRNGVVRFDGWVLPAKIMDLPTIIESHKTLDNKNFHKTADICQIMICKEEADEVKEESEETIKKSKDGMCFNHYY